MRDLQEKRWWRGTELNCRHHDFQSGLGTGLDYVILCEPNRVVRAKVKVGVVQDFPRISPANTRQTRFTYEAFRRSAGQ